MQTSRSFVSFAVEVLVTWVSTVPYDTMNAMAIGYLATLMDFINVSALWCCLFVYLAFVTVTTSCHLVAAINSQ